LSDIITYLHPPKSCKNTSIGVYEICGDLAIHPIVRIMSPKVKKQYTPKSVSGATPKVPLTRSNFFAFLQKVTRPIQKPPTEKEKPQT